MDAAGIAPRVRWFNTRSDKVSDTRSRKSRRRRRSESTSYGGERGGQGGNRGNGGILPRSDFHQLDAVPRRHCACRSRPPVLLTLVGGSCYAMWRGAAPAPAPTAAPTAAAPPTAAAAAAARPFLLSRARFNRGGRLGVRRGNGISSFEVVVALLDSGAAAHL